MKTCFKCGESQPLDCFYKHPMMDDGHLGKCIECTKADARANRASRIEYYRAYDKGRNRRPDRQQVRRDRPKAAPIPEQNPVKYKARNALNNALRDGKIARPTQCDICGFACEPHGHHDDYERPLDVIWCCVACHALIHSYWRAQELRVA